MKKVGGKAEKKLNKSLKNLVLFNVQNADIGVFFFSNSISQMKIVGGKAEKKLNKSLKNLILFKSKTADFSVFSSSDSISQMKKVGGKAEKKHNKSSKTCFCSSLKQPISVCFDARIQALSEKRLEAKLILFNVQKIR